MSDPEINSAPADRNSEKPERSVPGSTPPVAVANGTDTPAEAEGRRILSTAFVRVGPDGHLTVDLRDGRTMVLRNVVMRPKDFCGAQVAGDLTDRKYCGGYASVAAARPGGGPSGEIDAALSNAGDLKPFPAKQQ